MFESLKYGQYILSLFPGSHSLVTFVRIQTVELLRACTLIKVELFTMIRFFIALASITTVAVLS